MNIEELKHDPGEFGGVQPSLLPPEAIPERRCSAMFCSGRGFAQIPILEGMGWRVVCAYHAHKLIRVIGDTLRQPDYMEAADSFAKSFELPPEEGWTPSQYCAPEDFRCNDCGGRMQAEVGRVDGKRRWNHTCL